MTQATRDAMADAETLRLFSDRQIYIEEVWMAGYYGTLAAGITSPNAARSVAMDAAHKAFSACPELRR